MLSVDVSTLDRWIARGAIDTGGIPGSTRQEIAPDMVIELACILGRVRYRPRDALRQALGEVWRARLELESVSAPSSSSGDRFPNQRLAA